VITFFTDSSSLTEGVVIKYLKSKDGSFAGSVGDGRDNVPKPAVKHGLFSKDGSGVRSSPDLSGVAAKLKADEAREDEANRMSEDYGFDVGALLNESDDSELDEVEDSGFGNGW